MNQNTTKRFELCENCQKIFNVKELNITPDKEKYCNKCMAEYWEAVDPIYTECSKNY